MGDRLTLNGWLCQPPSVSFFGQTDLMEGNAPKQRDILARNLKALMSWEHGPSSQSELKRRSGVSQATIGRIDRKESDATIDTLALIARAYGLAAWQLLVPEFDPTNPPVLRAASQEEKKLYSRLRSAIEDLEKLK